MIQKVISGGQTGADRAGLDAAIDAGVAHGGWCPAGRKASDGPIPERYQLKETESDKYPPRTEHNVNESDGTLIFCKTARVSPGSKLTRSYCTKHDTPYLMVDVATLAYNNAQGSMKADIARLVEWVKDNDIKILNVAGSRESKCPGIYFLTYETITGILKSV